MYAGSPCGVFVGLCVFFIIIILFFKFIYLFFNPGLMDCVGSVGLAAFCLL